MSEKKLTKLLIGSDPEFIISDGSDYIEASRFMRFSWAFGTDGASDTAELRPRPARDALTAVANTGVLIRDGLRKITQLKPYGLLAGHYKHGLPIGGHIHLSGFTMNPNIFGPMLDKTLGRLSDGVDELTERDRRHGCGYGSGWRQERGANRIEYRMPGSWLLNPQIAFLNLWLAEATTYCYVGQKKEPLEAIDKTPGPMGLLAFAERVGDVPNKKTFIKVADKVFSHLPVNWKNDFKGAW